MPDPLADQIMAKIGEVALVYNRLVVVVGPAGSGKTTALLEVEKRTDAPRSNVNLELSRCLLELTEQQRPLHVQQVLRDLLAQANREVVLLDNIELLFDVSLKQDPFRLLQGLSRARTLAVAWPGTLHSGRLLYASPGHPEYKEYQPEGAILIETAIAE
jgi:ABC-type uncharacterized transport system ATPase component